MKKFFVCLLTLLTISCAEVVNESENPAGPTIITPVVSNIEFRVSGNVVNADIRYISPEEGSVFTTSYIPWSAKTKTSEKSFFVHIEAQGKGNGFTEETIQAQIIIDGKLFRESIVKDFLPKVTVSGTFSR